MDTSNINSYIADVLKGGVLPSGKKTSNSTCLMMLSGGLFGSLMETFAASRNDQAEPMLQGGQMFTLRGGGAKTKSKKRIAKSVQRTFRRSRT